MDQMSAMLDERFATLDEKMARLEKKQAQQLDELNDQINKMTLQQLKEKTLNEVEQQVEFQKRRNVLCEMESKLEKLQSANLSLVAMIFTLQNAFDDKMNECKVEIGNMKKFVRKTLKMKLDREVFSGVGSEDSGNGSVCSEKQTNTHNQINECIKQIDEVKPKEHSKRALLKYVTRENEDSSSILGGAQITAACEIDEVKPKEHSKRALLKYVSRENENSSSILGGAQITAVCEVNNNILQRKDLNETANLVWKIPIVQEKVTQNLKNSSEVFPLTGYPFLGQVVFELEGSNVSLLIRFVNPDVSESQQLPPKVIPRVHFLLKDQSGNDEPQDIVRSGGINFGQKLKFDTYYTFRRFNLSKTLFLLPSYIADGAVTMEIHAEPFDVANRVHSRDGNLCWTVLNYRKGKELEKKELVMFQLSPYFYTAPRGYRVQATVFLNGGGANRDRGLSVGISFLTGEFDHELGSSFSHVTSVTIFKPDEPNKQINKSVTSCIRPKSTSYFVDLWAHDVIEGFLVNDSLSIKVAINLQ